MRHPSILRHRLVAIVVVVFSVAALLGSCRVPPPGRGATPSEDLYRQNCALCHGVNGGGAQGPPIIDRPRTPQEIEAVVRSGGAEMPSFSEKLTQDEISAISQYASRLSQAD